MPIKLNSTGGGSVTLDVPSTASNFTLTVPAVTANLITTGDTGSISTTMIADSTVVSADLSQPLTFMSSQASTSGTAINFTSIPSWAKRINVLLNGVSTNGTSLIQVQLGSTTYSTSGYTGYYSKGTNASTRGALSSGFITTAVMAATTNIAVYGTFLLQGSNVWVGFLKSFEIGLNPGYTGSGGSITLGGSLDRLRITTVNGTDTFDAGSINVTYD